MNLDFVFFVLSAMGVFALAFTPILWIAVYLGERGLK